MKPLAIAYYLGQFHPTPENDEFWGPGFTEWHNVAKARPLYPGHVQPVLPGALGFYDLRTDATLAAQIDLAQHTGIDAFCHWHYWFGGRRLLHAPLDAMLARHRGSIRFMLGWANESWTGVWHGLSRKVLIEQTYGAEERAAHAQLIARYAEHADQLMVDGRLPLLIYKPRQIPQAIDYIGELREAVKRHTGASMHVIGNWSPGRSFEVPKPADLGLDAVVVTPVAAYFGRRSLQVAHSALWQGLRKVGAGPELRGYAGVTTTLQRALRDIDGTAHASIVTGWDNTPRSARRGLVLTGYDAASLGDAARAAIAHERNNTPSMLFVKSWNEWAEGNVVEPRFGETWSVADTLRSVLR